MPRIPIRFLFLASLAILPGAGDAAPPPRGVILFLGDGMGVAVVTAARIHRGAIQGLPRPVEAELNLDRAPRSALLRTWCSDHMVTDSAAGITALLSGAKVPMGAIGADRAPGGATDTLATVFEIARSLGLATGVVTTTRLTHATPAGAYAHTLERNDEESIALSLVPSRNSMLGTGLDVVLGGGRELFLPSGTGYGGRSDLLNLLGEIEQGGYRMVSTATELDEAVRSGSDRVFGAFTPSHMAYEADRVEGSPEEPSLAAMTRAAIEILRRDPEGYLLLVEGGRIDHALHASNGYRAVTDMLAFDEAVGVALEEDLSRTLILITADHDHSMVLAGYPAATEDVFTEAGKDVNGFPYTALLFANGRGPGAQFPDTLTAWMLSDPDFRERSGVPLRWETHGGMDVPLYAFGPGRFLNMIHGSMENTEVFGILAAAVREPW